MSNVSDHNAYLEVQRLRSELEQAYQQLDQKSKDLQMYKDEVKRLNQQLQTLIKNIQNQLVIATQVQKYLVPTEIPKIPGFKFSTKYIAGPASGGDYFDIFQLKDKRQFAVIMASSSGHTMAALLLSVLIQMSSQMEAKKGMSPSSILKSLSQKLLESAPSSDTSSVFLLIANRHKWEMTYSSAGHIKAWFQPYRTNAQDPSIQPLLPTSPLLGSNSKHTEDQNTSTDQRKIAQVNVPLNAKDRIVIVSPGLANAFDQKISMEDILIKMKNKDPHDLRHEIIYQAQKKQCQNDMTAIVMNVKDRILKLA